MNAVPFFPPSRHRRQGPRLLRVLPAEDRRDGGAAVGDGAPGWQPLEAAFRLGDLWRRRLDARAHRAHGRAHPDRIQPDAGRAPDLRRRQRATRSTRSIAEFAAMGVKRFVALRGDPAEGVGARYRPHPGGYANGAELVGGAEGVGRFRHFGLGLSGKASGKPGLRHRHRDAEAQGRQWRDAGDHPVLLRQRSLRALCRARAPRRHLHPDRAGHPAGPQFHAGREFLGALRRAWCRPGWPSASTGWTSDPQTHALVAAAVAAEQVLDLVERGVGDFHFYTMNRADLAFAICHMIGIRARWRRPRQPAAWANHDVSASRANHEVLDWLMLECHTPSSLLVGKVAERSESDRGLAADEMRKAGPHTRPLAERPGVGPAFLDSRCCLKVRSPGLRRQGSTPIMRAPIKANAMHIINALIGRVSPMVSLLYRLGRDSRPDRRSGKRKRCCNAT